MESSWDDPHWSFHSDGTDDAHDDWEKGFLDLVDDV